MTCWATGRNAVRGAGGEQSTLETVLYQGHDEGLAVRIAKHDGPQKRLFDSVRVKTLGGHTLYRWEKT